MRMTLKEIAVLLEDLNQQMCKQSVQQEIIMSEETPVSQMRQIMDLSLREQNSSGKKLTDKRALDDFDEILDEKQKEVARGLKRKSNLQLIDSIRMNGKMMQMRFHDFLDKDSNVYLMLAKEKEKNKMLQSELHRYESEVANSNGSPNQANIHIGSESKYRTQQQSAFQNMDQFASTYQRDTLQSQGHTYLNSQQKYTEAIDTRQSNFTMGQLSPAAPQFQMRQPGPQIQITDYSINEVSAGEERQTQDPQLAAHFENANNEEPIREIQETLEDSQNYNFHLSQDLLKKLEEKDCQIRLLNEYIGNIKEEFSLFKQQSNQMLQSFQQQSSFDRTENSPDANIEIYQKQQDKLLELHTVVYNLKRQNSVLETQLRNNLREGISSSRQGQNQLIKVQDNMEQYQLMSRQNVQRDSSQASVRVKHINSNSSKKHDSSTGQTFIADSVLVPDTINVRPRTKSGLEDDQMESSFHVTKSMISDNRTGQTQSMRMRGASIDSKLVEDPNNPSNTVTKRHLVSSHIGEHAQQSVNTAYQQQELVNLQRTIQILDQKLRANIQMNQTLAEQLYQKDNKYSELRVLVQDLKGQGNINSDALDKAGKVIQKLNDDLEKTTEAMIKLQDENKQLKEDNRHNRLKLGEMESVVKGTEVGCDAKIKRIDNELNLEIRDLKDALSQYQRDTEQEKKDLQAHIDDQAKQLNRRNEAYIGLEKKSQEEHRKWNETINKKSVEALNLHDSNLSLKIAMSKLEQQLTQDIEVREELNQKHNMFLKNQINDLQLKLKSQTQNRYFINENSMKKVVDQDGEEIPKVNGSYLTQLGDEFTKMSDELLAARKIMNANSEQTLESFLSKHIPQFNEFKLRVLDGLIDWYSKSNQLAKQATKYSDTLEEYKMLFVQMKQLVKEKDMMLKKLQNHTNNSRNLQMNRQNEINQQVAETSQETLHNLKKMTKLLELKVRVKETESEELIRYQEEFRMEYIKVCNHRDELQRQNEGLSSRLELSESELQRLKQDVFDYKENLRKLLNILEGPHCHEIVPQHIESLLDSNKTIKAQLSHYQEKSTELTGQMEDQRTMFQSKIQEMERQLEASQKQYLEKQDEAQDSFIVKEQELEKQISGLSVALEKANHEVQMRERQMKKHEAKLDGEQAKQIDLQVEIDSRKDEIQKLLETNNAIQDTYDLIGEKLKSTEQLLDQRNQYLDQQEMKLKEAYNRSDIVEVDLQNAKQEICQRDHTIESLNKQSLQLKQDVVLSQAELRTLREQHGALSSQLNTHRQNENKLAAEKAENSERLKMLEKQAEKDIKDLNYYEQELKRYQESVAYLSRQLDGQKIQELDIQILQKEKEKLNEVIQDKEHQIKGVYDRYVNNPRNSMGCQTDQSCMGELELLRQEVFNSSQLIQEVEDQREQLKQAMRRQTNDIDRLIDEKRQLEQEIELKNTQIYNMQRDVKKDADNVNFSNYNHLRHRSNSPNHNNSSTCIGSFDDKYDRNARNVEQIIKEKENFISKLEIELSSLRGENENIKDKILMYEIQNYGSAGLQAYQTSPGLKTLKSSNLQNATTMNSNNYTTNFNDRVLSGNDGNNISQHFSNRHFTQQINPVNTGSLSKSNDSAYPNFVSNNPRTQPQQFYASRHQFDGAINIGKDSRRQDISLGRSDKKFAQTSVGATANIFDNQDRGDRSPDNRRSPQIGQIANENGFTTLQNSADGLSNSKFAAYLEPQSLDTITNPGITSPAVSNERAGVARPPTSPSAPMASQGHRRPYENAPYGAHEQQIQQHQALRPIQYHAHLSNYSLTTLGPRTESHNITSGETLVNPSTAPPLIYINDQLQGQQDDRPTRQLDNQQ